jgi:hypothetical protein
MGIHMRLFLLFFSLFFLSFLLFIFIPHSVNIYVLFENINTVDCRVWSQTLLELLVMHCIFLLQF